MYSGVVDFGKIVCLQGTPVKADQEEEIFAPDRS